jgi:hypothetical protein
MGNTWTCDNCQYENYGTRKVCIRCSYNTKTGENYIISSSLTRNQKLFNQGFGQSSGVSNKIRLTQKARNKAPSHLFDKADHFVDSDFPPLNKSLYVNGSHVKRHNLLHSTGFIQVKKWSRPQDLHVSSRERDLPLSLFSDPSPKDVIQGELGTCWFLSALSLLAEKPFLLLNSMVTKYYNIQGLHQVRFLIHS